MVRGAMPDVPTAVAPVILAPEVGRPIALAGSKTVDMAEHSRAVD
ncbi:MAG: hypothetical protein NVS3B2_02380 [Ramlibacter sp.]